jgi:hypothetical protein
MKNSKIISLIIIVFLIFAALLLNFSYLKNSFAEFNKAISSLKVAKEFIPENLEKVDSFGNLTKLRKTTALVSFEQEDLSLFQKFFPVLLEKKFGLKNVSLNIIKQYASFNNKKIFNCNIKFSGDYTQFLRAVNNNFPVVFVNKLEMNGASYSAELYGYVADMMPEFIYTEGVNAYSLFRQIGRVDEEGKKVFEGAVTFTKDKITYFLFPVTEAKSFFVCENIVGYLRSTNDLGESFLILPIENDLSIRE